MRTLILATALLASGSLLAGDTPGFAVLKSARGDSAVFEAVSQKDLKARKEALLKAAKDEHDKWEAAKAAFLAKKENHGKSYLELEPEAVTVTVAKGDFPDEVVAQAWAGEQTEKARRWIVAEVTECDGKKSSQVLEKSKVHERLAALMHEYQKRLEAWEQDMAARPPPGTGVGGGHGGPPPGGHGPPPPPASKPRPTMPKLESAGGKDYTAQKDAEEALKALK